MMSLRWSAVLGIGLVLLLAGCGGGDESTGERSLTKKQFVRLADDFCFRESKAEERDMARYRKENGLKSSAVNIGRKPWEEEKVNEAVVFDYVRDKIAYFKSLPAPEGDEKEVREMIEAFEDGLRKSEEVPAALVAARPGAKPLPEPFTESYHTTSAYGPWICAQP